MSKNFNDNVMSVDYLKTKKEEAIAPNEDSVDKQVVNQTENVIPDIQVDKSNSEEEQLVNTEDFKDFFDEVIGEMDSYLKQSLAKYDNDDFLGNQSFKKLYKAAFDALGTKLNTDMFVTLLDDYVKSRIEAYANADSVKRENDDLTDMMQFQSGQSKKSQKKLRMQDIPDDELEAYIAKYI